MYYDDGGGLMAVALVFIVIVAVLLIGDGIFAEQVAHREVIQFMGYDDSGFFIVTVTEKGETRFNVDFRMYERLEVGQEVFASYRVGKLSKYKHKVMETN